MIRQFGPLVAVTLCGLHSVVASAAIVSVIRNDNLGSRTGVFTGHNIKAPVLNDAGRMVYLLEESVAGPFTGSPGSRSTIYYQSPTTRYTVASETSETTRFGVIGFGLEGYSLNNNGTMIYSKYAQSSYQNTVAVAPETSPTGTTIQLLSAGSSIHLSRQSLNNFDDIVFGLSGQVRRWDAGVVTTLATDGGFIFGVSPFGPVSNDAGSFAYRNASLDINYDPAGPILSTTIDPTIVPNSADSDSMSLNEVGELAFIGTSNRVFVVDSSFLPVAITEPIGGTGVVTGVSINNAGRVAYSRGGSLYFARASTLTSERLLGLGDPFGGSTLTFVGISAAALNNNDQIAFNYRLANNTHGVAIIQVIPELSASTLVGLAGALFLSAMASRSLRKESRSEPRYQ